MGQERTVLAIDTASPLPAVALAVSGELFEESLPADRRASEELFPAVRRCLDRAGLEPGRIGRLALCAGPGSFTGLRVGLATAWGWSRAAGIPVETVSTLEAIAEAWRPAAAPLVWTALDAGRGEAVFQEFDVSGERAVARGRLSLAPRRSVREAAGNGTLLAVPRDLLEPDGPTLALSPARALALAVARSPRPPAIAPFEPIYSRPSAAEETHGAA